MNWSASVVAHNEGTQPDGTSRLRTWIQHWKPLCQELVVVLHNCDDDSACICAELGVVPIQINISGLMESLLWEPPLFARPDVWHWRTGGVDEFVSADCLKRAEAAILANPDVRLYWVGRKNFCDGADISHLLGTDWQVALMLPQPLSYEFKGGMHNYPEIKLHASSVGMMDPNVCWIEHRRTFAEIERCNRSREGFCSPQTVQAQDRFIEQVRQAVAGKGKA